MKIRREFTKKFTTSKGILYEIMGRTDGTFELWQFSNKQSGWAYKGKRNTYIDCYNLMLSIAPEPVKEI